MIYGTFKASYFAAEEQIAALEQFYEQLGTVAKAHGVVVSVISIEGQECKLENLGQVADVTGGDVTKVNPLKLTENFQSILEKPVIATGVSGGCALLHEVLPHTAQ